MKTQSLLSKVCELLLKPIDMQGNTSDETKWWMKDHCGPFVSQLLDKNPKLFRSADDVSTKLDKHIQDAFGWDGRGAGWMIWAGSGRYRKDCPQNIYIFVRNSCLACCLLVHDVVGQKM